MGDVLHKAQVAGDVDFLREGVRVLSQTLMELEVSLHLGAERHERTESHTGQRNGYRLRQWDTRVGTIDLHVPRVPDGGFIPSLLRPRKPAERALVAVVQQAYLHFVRNALTLVPKSATQLVAATIRTVFAQADPGSTGNQWRRVTEGFRPCYPRLAELMDDAEVDGLAYPTVPSQHWRQLWSTNPLARINKEIKRRTNVVGIFPNRIAVTRLVGMVLAEQHDEIQVGRQYFSAESLAQLDEPPIEHPQALAAAD
jgi:putative transposase